ncbi:MAG: hypothetical protein ACI9CF_001904 [Candidatus Omnitrophota bacterium]|jgi:uncharacterized protein (TIRG00374 family)
MGKHIWIKIAATGIGLWLLYASIQQVSWVDLVQLFKNAGWVLLLTVFVYPIASICHALALRALIPRDDRSKIRFIDIYTIRMIGDALNKVTPFVDLGGEPLKVYLLSQKKLTSLSQAVVAVWMSKIGFVASEIVFILLGWLGLHLYYPNYSLNWVIWTGLIISLIYLAILVLAQKNGAIRVVPKLIKKINLDHEDSQWQEADKGLKLFFSTRSMDAAISFGWQFLGWVLALFEVLIAFRILGLEITLGQAFIFQSILQVIKTASFMIPGNLGAQEKGLAMLAIHLGYSATDGFILSAIKRFRQFVWVVGGLILWKRFNSSKHNDSP